MVLAARILVFSLLLVACGGESAAREATPTAPPAAAVGEGALGSTPPAAPLPEGPIPGWCRIDARWASLTEPVSLEALCDAILHAPLAGARHTHASLCESAELAYGSPDCPTDGPWLAQSLEGELTLVFAQPGGLYARIPELAWLSDGTEQTSELGRWELAAAHPLDAGSSVTVSELWCLDEDNSEDCGLAESDLIHKMLREVDDRILRVTATIDLRRAPPEADSGPPTLEVSGDSFTLSVCGGHGRFPLPTVPSATPDTPRAPAPPATEAEARAAAAQCAEGWRAFGAGDVDTARATIDAALEVLERTQDARGLRARGACLYNRGRVAEQDADVRAARGYYQRSLEARPNDVVMERLRGLL